MRIIAGTLWNNATQMPVMVVRRTAVAAAGRAGEQRAVVLEDQPLCAGGDAVRVGAAAAEHAEAHGAAQAAEDEQHQPRLLVRAPDRLPLEDQVIP